MLIDVEMVADEHAHLLWCAHELAPVTPDEEPGDAVLVIGEGRVDRHERAPGAECRRGQLQCLVGGVVVQVVENTDRRHQRAIAEHVVDLARHGGDEPSTVTEPLTCRLDIPVARVEPEVVHVREMLDDVGRSAPDVEDPVAVADLEDLGSQRLAECLRSDGALGEPVRGSERQNRAETGGHFRCGRGCVCAHVDQMATVPPKIGRCPDRA